MVLTVGIVSDLICGDVFQWGKIMAGCVIAAALPIGIYAFLMDCYIAGLTAGATRGEASMAARDRPCVPRYVRASRLCIAASRASMLPRWLARYDP